MTGMKNNDAGKIEDSTGMINQETGMINDNTGMLEGNTGLIDNDAGLITENNNEESTTTGRRKRSKERGKDLKPRDFPLHTLKNLPQFRDKPHEEIRQYILEKKGVDIGSNFNWSNFGIAMLIMIAVMVGGYGLWKWHRNRKSQSDYVV